MYFNDFIWWCMFGVLLGVDVVDFLYFVCSCELFDCFDCFMCEYVILVELVYVSQFVGGVDYICWCQLLIVEMFKEQVCVEGLWNLFLLDGEYGVGFFNVDYVLLVECMGYSFIVLEVFNCNVLDSGNMEVLVKYGMLVQQVQWFKFLFDGVICLVFCMIELEVVFFDVINMCVIVILEGDEVVFDGYKWWFIGIGYLYCWVLIFMGLIDLNVLLYVCYLMVLCLLDVLGVNVECMFIVFYDYDELGGYGQVCFDWVCVLVSNILFGFGCGFEIVQG